MPSHNTPPPVTSEVYDAELRTIGSALHEAFAGIGSASSLGLMEGQINSAVITVHTATQRLTAIAPPAQYVTTQADLISALDQLATRLSGLEGQVKSRELCAAQPVMATFGNLSEADSLRRIAQSLGPSGADLSAALPAANPLPDRRMINGIILHSPGSGMGEITAENGTDHDAEVTISHDGQTTGSFYVTRGETARMTNIPDGAYDIFFTTGEDWDGAAFTRSCSFQRFDHPANFTTSKTRREITYTRLSITLQPVPDGTAQTVDVPPDSFPK